MPYAPRSAGVRFLFLILVFLVVPRVALATLATSATLATPPGADPAPTFLLEKITVAGNRRPASARIVVLESLLQEGQSYAEDDLRVAIRRIKRLPFIIEADFALKEGTERGRYELVVAVEEMRPIFANVHFERNTGGEDPIAANFPFPQPNVDFDGDSLVGLREFVGSTGLVFATAGNSNSLSQAGYTHYGLFGAGSFATVAVAYDPFGHNLTPSLSAGVALTVNQSLRAAVSRLKTHEGSGPFRIDIDDRTAELDWLYDTTDDPFFPTRGHRAEAAVVYQSFDDRFKELGGSTLRSSAHIGTLKLSGRHHQPLSERQSLFFGLTGSTYRYSAFESSPEFRDGSGATFGYQATVEAGHAVDLWRGERARDWGKLRLETTASYVMASTARSLRSFDDVDPAHQLSLRAALVYRSRWAVVRLSLLYSGKVMR